MKYKSSGKNSESGVALVTVLVMLMTVSILVMSMAVYSQLAVFGIANDTSVQRSRYIAEGAMNRVIFLMAADNNVYNTTELADFDYEEYEDERFLPDGRLRELDYYGTTVTYRIENGMGGISFDLGISNALNMLTKIRATDEEDLSDASTIFLARYNDYVDNDDSLNVDGMEHDDYEESEENTQLPRDNAMQFREELWYIPDGVKFFPPDRHGRMTILNPPGMGGSRSQKPDLLQANYALLTNYSNLSHEDAMETLRIINAYKKEYFILSEEMDSLLLANLRNYFTTNNSGCYRVTIENASGGDGASVRMDATYFNPGIESEEGFQLLFYDWLIY